MKRALIVLAYLWINSLCSAEIIIVDPNEANGDFTSIQEAIIYSWDGDTIIVNPGTYPENLYYDNRAILLTSINPNDPNIVENTVIQGTITFNFNEGLDSILTGFTVAPDSNNDGIICYGSNTMPLIEKNRITGRSTAIYCEFGAAPYIVSNVIENNSNGISGCEGRIEGNIIRLNSENGIYSCTGDISGNTVINNSSCGIRYVNGDVIGNTITNNSDYGIFYVDGNVIGNIITGNVWGISGIRGKIENNVIANNQYTGIDSCNGEIIGNTITGNNGNGISNFADFTSQGLIYQNEISNNTENGLIQCWATIYENTINNNGGAGLIYCYTTSIRDNTISGNTADGIGECRGSIERNVITENDRGIFNCYADIDNNYIGNNRDDGVCYESDSYVPSQVNNNTIINNGGMGIDDYSSQAIFTVRNNLIAGNRLGGVSDCINVVNNTIVENLGHGIFECDETVKNNIIAYNQGIGIYGPCDNGYNCFWQNTSGSFFDNYGKTGDQSMNPLFADLGSWNGEVWTEGDYTLLSEYGRWDNTTGLWVVDVQTSPCIDAGDPADEIFFEPNPNGGRINMGAYGGTEYASKSNLDGPDPNDPPVIPPLCVNPPSMDTNDDCKIDLFDFSEFASQWMTCGLDIRGACWE